MASVDDVIASAVVVFFEKPGCPFCADAERVLWQGRRLKKVDIVGFRQALTEKTGMTSAPSVWIKGTFVGGLPMLSNGKFDELLHASCLRRSLQLPKGGRTDFVVRPIHSAGRSRFALQERATLKDLKEVFLSTGVLGHLQQLTFDAHPILGVDSAPLSSVGLGHGALIWLRNVFSASPLVSGAASSHQCAKYFCTLNQQDFTTQSRDTLPAQFRSTQIDATSSPASAQLAPTLWDSPSSDHLRTSCHHCPCCFLCFRGHSIISAVF